MFFVKDVIMQLYLDQADDEPDHDEQFAKVKNELETARAAIQTCELEKADYVAKNKNGSQGNFGAVRRTTSQWLRLS